MDALSKTFGRRHPVAAVNGLSFSVRKGKAFGILGAPGAGKTTVLRILATILRPTAGTVHIDGIDLFAQAKKARELLGFAPQTMDFSPWLSARQFLDYWARINGHERRRRRGKVQELLEFLEIADQTSLDPIETTVDLQRRLTLGQALLSDPPLLILDEPMMGLDLAQKSFLAQKLGSLQKRGHTIILSSALLRDIQLATDHVTILREGRATDSFEKHDLLRKIGHGKQARIFIKAERLPSGALAKLRNLEGVLEVKSTSNATILYIEPGKTGEEEVKEVLKPHWDVITEVKEAEVTLGDVFNFLHTEEET